MKYSKTGFLVKNAGILTIGNFASKILVFLLVPLYTNVLSTAEYGTYDLAVSTATLLYPILTLNIADGIMRFFMDRTYDHKDIASLGFRYICVSTALFGGGMLLLSRLNLWPDIHGLEQYVFLYYLSYTFQQYLLQIAKGLEQVKDIAVSGVISTVIMLATNITFLLVFRWGLPGFFLANILSQLLAALYLMLRVKLPRLLDLRKKNPALTKAILLYCTPLIANTLGWWVNGTADKYTVAILCGMAANGLLSVAYKIPQIIHVLQNIFIQAWQISAIKEYGDKDTAVFYGRTFTVINLLMCIACAFLIILTKPLAAILYAKDFYTAWQYVPFLIISIVLNCASGLLGPMLSAKRNSKAMMWSAIYGALANIVLNILLVYLIGIQGATIATVISSYVIYAARKRAVGSDVFIADYQNVYFTWLLICAQAVIEIYTPFWYAEIAIILLIFLVNFREIKKDILLVLGLLRSRKEKGASQ